MAVAKKGAKRKAPSTNGDGVGGANTSAVSEAKRRKRLGVMRIRHDAADEDIAPPVEQLDESRKKRNKEARVRSFQKLKLEKAVRKLARREKRKSLREEHGEAAVPKLIPKTTDNMREGDDTMVHSDDEEVGLDEQDDEYFERYHDDVEPNILLTTQIDPCPRTRKFMDELLAMIPNSEFFERRGYAVKQITQFAVNRGYTDIIIVGDSGGGQKRFPCMHTAFMFYTSFLPTRCNTQHRLDDHDPSPPGSHPLVPHLQREVPQRTRGRRRAVDSLPRAYHEGLLKPIGKACREAVPGHVPAGGGREGYGACLHTHTHAHTHAHTGRGVITFHNHRDFIFVRSHRYLYESTESVRLQELGPRFTLRLRSLQAGLFNPRYGEYEWFRKKKEMDKNRRRFHL